MWLETVATGYGLTDSVVSSVRAKEGSGLSVSQYPFGGSANSGDLLIGLDWTFTENVSSVFPSRAVTGIRNRELTLGPVLSGLRIDSSRLKILASDQLADGYHFGRITLGDPTGNIGRELPFEATHLNGVEEAVEREAIGLAFPADRASSLLGRIAVPFDTTFTKFAMSFSFGILTTRSGNIAADTFKGQVSATAGQFFDFDMAGVSVT